MRRRIRSELQQTKPFPSLEVEVFVEIARTAQVTGRWVAEALKPSRLSAAQFNVLRILRGARPKALSSRMISERMVNHDPDLTRLLDRLETSGFVEKARDATDRRVVNVRITGEGLKAVGRASDAVQTRLEQMLSPLGKQKLNTLADLLELVRATGA